MTKLERIVNALPQLARPIDLTTSPGALRALTYVTAVQQIDAHGSEAILQLQTRLVDFELTLAEPHSIASWVRVIERMSTILHAARVKQGAPSRELLISSAPAEAEMACQCAILAMTMALLEAVVPDRLKRAELLRSL